MSDRLSYETKGGGIGLSGALFCVFVALKLGVGSTAVMNWSWWWVCAPLWLPALIVLSVVTVVLSVWAMAEALKPHYPFSRKKFSKVKKLRKSFQKNDINWDQFASAMDRVTDGTDQISRMSDFVSTMTFDAEKSKGKSIRRHKEKTAKDRFSIKRWWKNGVQGDTLWQKFSSWYKNGNKVGGALSQKASSWYSEGNKKSEEKKAAKSEKKA